MDDDIPIVWELGGVHQKLKGLDLLMGGVHNKQAKMQRSMALQILF